jgi:hypothetical protein
VSVVQTSGYCPVCQRQSLFIKPRINHVLHLILSILTVGIWALFVWLPLGFINSGKRPRCQTCGSTPQMFAKPAPPLPPQQL